MIIVSDASPLSALAEIGEIECLRALYGQVVIPETVRRECSHARTPAVLVHMLDLGDTLFQVVPDPALLPETACVDPGEAAAISLAWQHRAQAVLLIDDLDGRQLCDALGIRKTGTAGVLLAAANAGLLDFDSAMTRLQSTTFRVSAAVIVELRRRLQPPPP
jgi:predicted nucleic acid-binding protein